MKHSLGGRIGRGLLGCSLVLLCGVAVLHCASSEDSGGTAPPEYPLIGDEEMGHLRWVIDLANQPLDDFTNFEAANQDDLTSYRYSIAFSAYFLAMEQYHKLPAWSEAIQPAIDRLIQKLILRPVWEYWAKTSRGVPTLEPDMSRPYPESHDPVGDKNIMYSGHLGHMINLYEMLYRDFKWDEHGSIVLEWTGDERYVYDNHSLERVMYGQMKNNSYHAICCEPNAVFAECNQHPVLSFLLYDWTHGTSLSEVGSFFMDFFVRNDMMDLVTRETAMLYLVKQGWTLSQSNPRYGNLLDLVIPIAVKHGHITLESATADGWTGTFMHGWQPGFINERYPSWKQHHVIDNEGSLIELKMESWEPLVRYGFFAMLAAEMGDIRTRDRLLEFADARYRPVWRDGTYHYPNNLIRGCTNLADKLFAFAAANTKDGVWMVHRKPFDSAHFLMPRIVSVDFPKVLVRRAMYDPAREALIVSVGPGGREGGTTSFTITQLDPGRSYVLFVDGAVNGRHQGAQTMSVTVDLEGPHTLILQAE